nr:MAG TPA: hypothetical protein [Caudoviricetes sp.]
MSTSFLLERVNSILTFLIIWRNIITAEKRMCSNDAQTNPQGVAASWGFCF